MEEKPNTETTDKIDLKTFENLLQQEGTHGENQGKNQSENNNLNHDSEFSDSDNTVDFGEYLSENVANYLSESEAQIARKACAKSINADSEKAADLYFRPIPSGVKFRSNCLKKGLGNFLGKKLKIHWLLGWIGSYLFDLFNHITGWNNQIKELDKILKPESK